VKRSADVPQPKLHAHWDKLVSAAYLRMLGATQKEAATAVGRTDRAIRGWESDTETWAAARAEARDRWLTDLTDRARGTLLASLKNEANGDLALKVLERVDDALLPPKQKLEHGGEGGGPIEVRVVRTIVRPDADGG
jgi:hypothetical protein